MVYFVRGDFFDYLLHYRTCVEIYGKVPKIIEKLFAKRKRH